MYLITNNNKIKENLNEHKREMPLSDLETAKNTLY